jgi:uncharacterized protein (DUF2236 family)
MVLRAKEYFVDEHSIVRQIWGKSDTILFIFAGASAEFALNKAVDWLYFTGRLPADPIGRLFSTVSYAKRIVFSEKNDALHTIDSIAAIHAHVEADRKSKIPAWAYRDVLFMLIDYSIRAFEVLERELSRQEKNEVLKVFKRLGTRMGLTELPKTFEEFEAARHLHLSRDLQYSSFTKDLFHQYRNHLGLLRYKLLLEVQTSVVPDKVRAILGLRKISILHALLSLYKVSKFLKIDWLLRAIILPSKYKKEISALDNSV